MLTDEYTNDITSLSDVIHSVTAEVLKDVDRDSFDNPTMRESIKAIGDISRQTIKDFNESVAKTGLTSIPRLNSVVPYQIAATLNAYHYFAKINLTDDAKTADEDLMPLVKYQIDGPCEGLYTEYTAGDISKDVRMLKPEATEKDCREVKQCLMAMVDTITRNKNRDLIAVNNGIFDYKKKILLPFSPDLVFMDKVATDYIPNPESPRIEMPDGEIWEVMDWLDSLADDDQEDFKELILKLIGASIRTGVNFDIAPFFYSEKGRNGKGTICQLIRNIIGPSGCVSITLKAMSERFALQPLIGATAVITDENAVGDYLATSDVFKSLVTHDIVTIDRKHKSPISYRFRGLIIQCVNELPSTRDKSDSLLRRIMVVPFTRNFTEEDDRKYIKDDYIARPEVLQYLLHYVLVEMEDYYKIETPAFCKAAMNKFVVNNDSVAAFLDDFLPTTIYAKMPWKHLYVFYKGYVKTYCPAEARKPLKYQKFKEAAENIINRDYNESWEAGEKVRPTVKPEDYPFDAKLYTYDIDIKDIYPVTAERSRTCLHPEGGVMSFNYQGKQCNIKIPLEYDVPQRIHGGIQRKQELSLEERYALSYGGDVDD